MLDARHSLAHKRKGPVRGLWCGGVNHRLPESDRCAVGAASLARPTLHPHPFPQSDSPDTRLRHERLTAETGQALTERLLRATLCHLRPGPEWGVHTMGEGT